MLSATRGEHRDACYGCTPMSKRRRKKRLTARRKKANHGRKPTVGRNS